MFKTSKSKDPIDRLIDSVREGPTSTIAGTVSSLIAVRSLLPGLLAELLDKLLSRIPGAAGKVGEVNLGLWDGRVTVDHLALRRFSSGMLVTLEVPRVSAVVQWNKLLRGSLLVAVSIERPRIGIRFPAEGTLPTAKDRRHTPQRRSEDDTWQKQIRNLLPIKIDRLVLSDGEAHFYNLPDQGLVDVRISNIQMSLLNLVNKEFLSNSMKATLEAEAAVMSSGKLSLYAEGFPLAAVPTFNTDVQLKNLELTEINFLLKKYFEVQVQRGTLDFYAEAAAAKGEFKGYVKPILDHLKMKKLNGQSVGEATKAALIRLATKLFKNAKRDRIATRVYFQGKFSDPSIDYAQGVLNFLKNAFIKAFHPSLDRSIQFKREGKNAVETDIDLPEQKPSKMGVFFSLTKQSVSRWSDDQALRLSAALSYYTVFSMAPLLILTIAVAGLAFGQKAAEGQIVAQIGGLVGEQGAQAIQSMIQAARKPSSGIIATVIGLITLLIGASGVMTELKDALNQIWRVRTQNGIGAAIKQKVLSFAMVLVIGFLLLVSLILSAGMAAAGKLLGGMLPVPEVVMQCLNTLISFGVITLLFALLYKILPDAQIRWHDVWVGSAATSFLFSIGKLILGLYLGKASVGSSYGAAGSVLVILLWVYYSAAILYFGAEFTKVYADRFGSPPTPSRDPFPQRGDTPTVSA